MAKHGPMPEEARGLIARLESGTAAMTALEEEVDALLRRLENADVAAIHLGVRRIAEALLRHATRAEGLELPKKGTLEDLKGPLRGKVKERVPTKFWRDIDVVQDAVNPNTHYQEDDVYRPAGFRRGDPWDEVLNVVRSLVCVAEEFAHHWPPPSELLSPTSSPDDEPSPAEPGADDESEADEPTEAPTGAAQRPQSAATRKPEANTRRAMTVAQLRALLDLTVAQARDDDTVRAQLAFASGLHARGVSRRLNATHGSTKLRRIFPSLVAELVESDDEGEAVQPTLDYQAIGNLTIKQARELEVADDIAALTGLSVATVKRKLRELHGGGVVRRQFAWYFADTIGELTVRTALQYELAPVLAAGLRERRQSVLAKLRAAPGQTKLRTVFPKLNG